MKRQLLAFDYHIRPIVILLIALAAASLLPAQQANTIVLTPGALNFTAAPGGLPATQTLFVQSTVSPLVFTVLPIQYFTGAQGWLSVSPTSGTTAAQLTVTADPSGLSVGTYTAQIGVQASSTQSSSVLVTLMVNGSGGSTTLVASPSTVFLSTQGSLTQSVQITAANGGSTPFSFYTLTSSSIGWLTVNNGASTGTGTTPQNITVSANPNGLTNGQSYTGQVVVTPNTGGTPLTISVTLSVGTVTGTGLSLSQTSLTFSALNSISSVSPQSVAVYDSVGQTTYTASSSATWVQLTSDTIFTQNQSVTGTTGQSFTVYINPAGFTAGNYNASVTVSAPNANTVTLFITLTVGSSSGLLSANPASLMFSYQPGGTQPANQFITITTGGAPLNFTVVPNSSGWLSVNPQSGSTVSGSNQLTVSVNVSSLANGAYSGSLNLTAVGAALSIPVTLSIGNATTSLVANPGSLTFQGFFGSSLASQSIQVTTVSGASNNFDAVATTGVGSGWLSVVPSFTSTPATVTVSVNQAALPSAGTYPGSITFTNTVDSTQLVVPVTVIVTGGQLQANPSSLTFAQPQGGTSPPTQVVQLTSTAGSVGFTVSTDSTWLQVTTTAQQTPAALTVTVNGGNLSLGTYHGNLAVSYGPTPFTIPVTLNVITTAQLSVTPGALNYSYQTGASPPAAQALNITSSGSAINFSASAQTNSGGNWLSISSLSSNSTPATINVAVNPSGLAPGNYTGKVTVSSSDNTQSQVAAISLVVTAPAPPLIATVANAASEQPGPVAPGEIVTIMGGNLGPAIGVMGVIQPPGSISTTLAGTQVMFDGVAAPLLYVSNTQINAVVPYEIASHTSTNLQINANGATSSTLTLQVAAASPGIFTTNMTGTGAGGIVNQDGSLNSPSNPAHLGSYISLFGTGEGQTSPAGQTGRIIVTDLRMPLLPVTLKLGGVPAEVTYAGSAPGFVSGALQVNVFLTQDIGVGSAVPVQLVVGSAQSPNLVTVAIMP